MRTLLLLSLFALFLPGRLSSQFVEELRGVKLTNVDSQVLFSDAAIIEAMEFLAAAGFNAVLPVVQNGGYTIYPSAVMDHHFDRPIHPHASFAGRDPLAVLIREAHKHGMEVYPWFEYGFATNYSGLTGPATGGFILQTYPDWAARHVNGDICKKNGFDWMNGINENVQNFMLELVMEVVRNYDVDGVEFSDRMPAMPVECGYDTYTRELYKTFNGVYPPTDPQNQSWKNWRANELTRFYKMVRDSVKGHDPELFVASSPNIYPWGLNEYLQDSRAWVKDGIIDHWVPQLYRYNRADYVFELNAAWNQPINDAGREKLIAGILMNVGSFIIPADSLRLYMQANRTRGVKGEAFFFYEGLRKNNNELGTLVKTEFYQTPATIPGRNGVQRYPTSIEKDDRHVGIELLSSYPNPFNPTTHIRWTMDVGRETRIAVYDVMGREIQILVDGMMSSGQHSVTFDAAGLPSGMYVIILEAAGFRESRKITLLK